MQGTKLEIMRPNKGVRATSSQRPKEAFGNEGIVGRRKHEEEREMMCDPEKLLLRDPAPCDPLRSPQETRRRALSSFQPESQLLTFNCAARSIARGSL